jgi:hypothetical protein
VSLECAYLRVEFEVHWVQPCVAGLAVVVSLSRASSSWNSDFWLRSKYSVTAEHAQWRWKDVHHNWIPQSRVSFAESLRFKSLEKEALRFFPLPLFLLTRLGESGRATDSPTLFIHVYVSCCNDDRVDSNSTYVDWNVNLKSLVNRLAQSLPVCGYLMWSSDAVWEGERERERERSLNEWRSTAMLRAIALLCRWAVGCCTEEYELQISVWLTWKPQNTLAVVRQSFSPKCPAACVTPATWR